MREESEKAAICFYSTLVSRVMGAKRCSAELLKVSLKQESIPYNGGMFLKSDGLRHPRQRDRKRNKSICRGFQKGFKIVMPHGYNVASSLLLKEGGRPGLITDL